MKTYGTFKLMAIMLATVGTLVPNYALGSQAVAGTVVQDIALQTGGTFNGQVVNAQGAPIADSVVILQQNGQLIARTATDNDGRFAFNGLRGGVYNVTSAAGSGVYRMWAPQTAPPNARDSIMFTANGTVLGQGGAFGFLGSPWVVAAVVATAIAVPIAVTQRSGS